MCEVLSRLKTTYVITFSLEKFSIFGHFFVHFHTIQQSCMGKLIFKLHKKPQNKTKCSNNKAPSQSHVSKFIAYTNEHLGESFPTYAGAGQLGYVCGDPSIFARVLENVSYWLGLSFQCYLIFSHEMKFQFDTPFWCLSMANMHPGDLPTLRIYRICPVVSVLSSAHI